MELPGEMLRSSSDLVSLLSSSPNFRAMNSSQRELLFSEGESGLVDESARDRVPGGVVLISESIMKYKA